MQHPRHGRRRLDEARVPNGGRLERHIDPKYPTEYIANIDRICAAKAKLEAFFL